MAKHQHDVNAVKVQLAAGTKQSSGYFQLAVEMSSPLFSVSLSNNYPASSLSPLFGAPFFGVRGNKFSVLIQRVVMNKINPASL